MPAASSEQSSKSADFYPDSAKPTFAPPVSAPYKRDLALTQPHCEPIASMAADWFEAEKVSAKAPGLQPSRVSIQYDPMDQLVHVDYPLDGLPVDHGDARGNIWSRFDLMGRTVELQRCPTRLFALRLRRAQRPDLGQRLQI